MGEVRHFPARTANGGTRTMTLCNAGDSADAAAMAQALSTAIEVAHKERFYADARMPELLSLRLSRARADVDPSLTGDARLRKLAGIDDAIGALEGALSKGAKPY
ncbi:MAG: hypothetical protein ABIR60_12530 [Allosphingosinicella sp.]